MVQRKRWGTRRVVLSAVAAVLAAGVAVRPGSAAAPGALAGDEPLRTALRQDAWLHDVFFLDPLRGWAVGDHGTIWRTLDGGDHWTLEQSGVDCPLRSVFFLNQQTGWAAGGICDPYTQTTHGVLLRTDDGGHTWARWQRALLPALVSVKFLNTRQGWAVAHTADLFPQGVFTTEDGGRTWTPAAPTPGQVWLAGDFVSPQAGAVVGRRGAVGHVRGDRILPTGSPAGRQGDLCRLRLLPQGTGCAVGPGGRVLTTADGGQTWQDRSAQLPADADRLAWDFEAVAAHGRHLWIAGSPGNRVFHSPDAGGQWQAHPTGQPLPIAALHFADPDRGWAVGGLGTILATDDGGRRWRTQRAGGRRAAWLAVFPHATAVPLELLARLSVAEGYLGGVLLFEPQRAGPLSPDSAFRPDRVRAALVAAGAGWVRFQRSGPVEPGKADPAAAAGADGAPPPTDRDPSADRTARLARQLRIWRPDVVITSPASPRGDDPEAHAVNQSLLAAARLAAQPRPPAGQAADLPPWEVKKMYAVLPQGSLGTVSLSSGQLIPAAGRSLGEYVARGRGILHDAYLPPPTMTRFQLLASQLPPGQGARDFFSGLSLRHGGDARRPYVPPADADLAQLRRSAARPQVVQAIIATAAGGGASAARLLAQINNLTANMRPDAAADVLLDLAGRFADAGQWDLAGQTYQLAVHRHPGTPPAAAALMELIRLSASAELQHVQRPAAARTVSATPLDLDRSPLAPATLPRTDTAAADQDPTLAAIRWGRQLQEADPLAAARPPVRLALASAYRRSGDLRQARRIWLGLQRSRPSDDWWRAAAGELWLTDSGLGSATPHAPHAVPVWSCPSTADRPLLDGRLDDPCWQPAAAATRRPGGQALTGGGPHPVDLATHVQLAYDDQFLYLAASCARAPGVAYPPGKGPRPRDATLASHDRLDLLLDTDRDRATYYRLTVDHRGWTADACAGSLAWNPAWYVAAATEGGTWTCEAAIAWDQLVAAPPPPGEVWTIGVRRTIPGVGWQSWTTPTSPDIMPAGFGYLRFD